MSQDWFECCRIAADDESVELLLVSDSVAPVALVPLRHRTSTRRGLRAKYLSLLDCPDSPFADIIPSGAGEPVAGAVLAHLATRSDWDILELGRLPSDSPTLKAFEGECEGRLRQRRAGAEMSPYLAIEGTWQAFYASRSQRFKKTIRNIQNRLARLGTVAFEEHRSLDPAGPVFEEMIDLTRRSWKAEEGVAIATMPRMRGSLPSSAAGPRNAGGYRCGFCGSRAARSPWSISSGTRESCTRSGPISISSTRPRPLGVRSISRLRARCSSAARCASIRWAPVSTSTRCAGPPAATRRCGSMRTVPALYPALLHFGETVLAPALRRVRDRLR